MVKKRMTHMVIIFIIFVVIWITTSYKLPVIYKEDYVVKYSEQLGKVFGGRFSIGECRTVSGIKDPEGPKYYYRYYEWDISYEDAYGNTHNEVLTNNERFGTQVFWWMRHQIEQYYCDLFINRFQVNSENMLCYCLLCRPETDTVDNEIVNAFFEKTVSEIENGDSNICLTKLGSNEFFSKYPMYLDIYLFYNSTDIANGIDTIHMKIESTLQKIIELSNGSCNLFIRVKNIDNKEIKYKNKIYNI